MPRIVVIGHTEWVEFVRVDRSPGPGDLVEGERLFEHAGGGAVVAAAVLAELGASVVMYTALTDDDRARRAREELEARGITVCAAPRAGTTRFVFTTLRDGGERTIVTVGERHAPALSDGLDLSALDDADGVYVTAADPGLLGVAARRPALVVTTRLGAPRRFAEAVADGDPGIAAAVYSDSDPSEIAQLDGWSQLAGLMVATEGAVGGHWSSGAGRTPQRGRWPAAAPPGPPADAYGCGDSFAAGFTFGLATGAAVADAAGIGARCGAEMLTRVGAP